MSDDRFERYRDALRTGHLAALRGAPEQAARAYREAARLLPERAAPHVALGRTLLASGRPAEALSAFDEAASRAPRDTAALDGAARALLELGRADGAAELLDGLASIYAEQDRRVDALATIERAIEISGSPWRRAMLEQLRGEQPRPGTEHAWLGGLLEPAAESAARGHARREASGQPVTAEVREIARRVEAASATDDVAGLVAGAQALARADRLRAAVDACHDALTVAPADPDVHRTLAAIYRRRGWERAARTKVRIVERYQRVVDDPDELERDGEHALVTGDLEELLRIVERHADQGRIAAALDLLFAALVSAPADPRLHLAIARLHLALGWRQRAVEEVNRLARLVGVTGDEVARATVADFVSTMLRPAARQPVPAG